MCSPLIVKSVFLILGMNEMSQFLDSVLRLETDTGDRCWRLCLWWRWEIDTELCLCSTLTGVLKNKHPYYKSSVFSVCSPLNSSCCDTSKHSETKIGGECGVLNFGSAHDDAWYFSNGELNIWDGESRRCLQKSACFAERLKHAVWLCTAPTACIPHPDGDVKDTETVLPRWKPSSQQLGPETAESQVPLHRNPSECPQVIYTR